MTAETNPYVQNARADCPCIHCGEAGSFQLHVAGDARQIYACLSCVPWMDWDPGTGGVRARVHSKELPTTVERLEKAYGSDE